MASREKVKAEFEDSGISIKKWAESRGFSPRIVYQVLDGKSQGLRGKSHAVAVALGIRKGLNTDDSEGLFDLEIEERQREIK